MKRNIIINSDILRKTRKAMEITQENMANKLGITRKTYERYENERAFLSKDIILKISDLLDIEYDMLVLLDIEKEIERIENYPLDELRKRLYL